MIKVAPSILSADFSILKEQIQLVEKGGADLIHIDVMDGMYVPNISIGPVVVNCIKKVTKLPFDVHLMIEQPDRYIEDFVNAGADIISVHAEATKHLHRSLQLIRSFGIKACVALNPATPLEAVDYVIGDVDMVLLMTVNPGFGGQKYIPSMTGKIRALKQKIEASGKDIDIQIDGGVGLDNIYEVTEAGANVIVAGSYVYGAEDVGFAISALKQSVYGETI